MADSGKKKDPAPDKEYVDMVAKSVLKMYAEEDKRKVGIGPTPMDLLYRQGPWSLHRCRGGAGSPHPPVVVVPSLINRPYIMDLLPGHSLLGSMVSAGLDVFLVDWGTPDASVGHYGFADYTAKFLRRAVRIVKRLRGVGKVSLVGQCIGGLIAALYAAHPVLSRDVDRLALLTTPLDFKDSGLLSSWTKKEHFDIDKITGAFEGVVPADFLHNSFPFLDSKKTLGKYRTLLENQKIPDFKRIWQALDIWANDNVPFALQAFRELIRSFYQENAFLEGRFVVDGTPVAVSDIAAPTLALAAAEDHVFTEPAAAAIKTCRAAKEGRLIYQVMPAGHVTVIAAHPVRNETFKLFNAFLTFAPGPQEPPKPKAKRAADPKKPTKKRN